MSESERQTKQLREPAAQEELLNDVEVGVVLGSGRLARRSARKRTLECCRLLSPPPLGALTAGRPASRVSVSLVLSAALCTARLLCERCRHRCPPQTRSTLAMSVS